MKTIGLAYYHEFSCLGGTCPQTCCRGWGIALDERTHQSIRETKGIYGLLLRASVKLLGGELPVYRNLLFRCPYQRRDGLCHFQKQGELCYLPKICRVYPRRATFYGDLTEVMFELSCVEAARLFLSHTARQTFVELPESDPLLIPRNSSETIPEMDHIAPYKNPTAEPPAESYHTPSAADDTASGATGPKTGGTTPESRAGDTNRLACTWILQNDDPGFREFLRRDREKLLDRLWEMDRPLEYVMADIYSYVWDLEKLVLGGRIKEAEALQECPMPYVDEQRINQPFYSVSMLNELIYQYLNEPELFFRNRPLFSMLRSYHKVYGKLWETEANAFFRNAGRKLLESGLLPAEKYRAYLSYCLQELYCEAYEDYYLLGPVLLSLIYTEFLMLLDTAVYLDKGTLSLETQAKMLAALEKGIRHSIRTREEFLQKIRRDFL